MKKKTNFLSLPLLFMGVFLFFASCWGKNSDDNNNTTNTFTDPRDGNVYQTITICNQVWMAENLKYLPRVIKDSLLMPPYYYVHGYDGINVADAKATANYNTYGVLYNWGLAQAACPEGWHLPAKSEFETLLNRYGGEGEQAYTALKSGGKSGFSALFGGGRTSSDGKFISNDGGVFWSSSDSDAVVDGWALFVKSGDKEAFMGHIYKSWYFSVRCVQD